MQLLSDVPYLQADVLQMQEKATKQVRSHLQMQQRPRHRLSSLEKGQRRTNYIFCLWL